MIEYTRFIHIDILDELCDRYKRFLVRHGFKPHVRKN